MYVSFQIPEEEEEEISLPVLIKPLDFGWSKRFAFYLFIHLLETLYSVLVKVVVYRKPRSIVCEVGIHPGRDTSPHTHTLNLV